MTVRRTDELTERLRTSIQELSDQQEPADTAKEVTVA
jgi:hypothetical protein